MKKYKKIGILGGMGPEATAQLYLKIIKIFQRDYKAVYDDDFPEIIILNWPIKDVVEKKPITTITELEKGIKKLKKMNVDFIAIPCNSVSSFIPLLRKKCKIEIISIIEETIKKINNLETIGIIATKTTIESKVYEKRLNTKRIIKPNKISQQKITNIILNILRGEKNDEDKKYLIDLINEMKKNGSEKIILGCTDLPLLINNKDSIDSLQIYAEAIVKKTTNGGK